MKRVLFVCLGNICRSPTAEAILRKKASDLNMTIEVDSAGTSDNHVGERSDPRSILHAEKRGYQMSHLARQFSINDFESFDKIFVMDQNNYKKVISLAKNDDHRSKVQRIAELLSRVDHDHIPDPYYGDSEDFQLVIELLEEACDNLLKR